MAKKTQVQTKEIRNSLTPEEYWEWRTTIAEMVSAQNEYLKTKLELVIMEKDAELLRARAQVFALSKVEKAKTKFDSGREEYSRFKTSLEEKIGQSLNDKIINDVNFEISEAPKQNIPKEG